MLPQAIDHVLQPVSPHKAVVIRDGYEPGAKELQAAINSRGASTLFRKNVLSSETPGDIASEGAKLARQYGFSDADIELIAQLSTAMQAWQPIQDRVAP